jgi:hypothetical protein
VSTFELQGLCICLRHSGIVVQQVEGSPEKEKLGSENRESTPPQCCRLEPLPPFLLLKPDHNFAWGVCSLVTARQACNEICSFLSDHLSAEVQYGNGMSTSSIVAPDNTITAIALAERKICGMP